MININCMKSNFQNRKGNISMRNLIVVFICLFSLMLAACSSNVESNYASKEWWNDNYVFIREDGDIVLIISIGDSNGEDVFILDAYSVSQGPDGTYYYLDEQFKASYPNCEFIPERIYQLVAEAYKEETGDEYPEKYEEPTSQEYYIQYQFTTDSININGADLNGISLNYWPFNNKISLMDYRYLLFSDAEREYYHCPDGWYNPTSIDQLKIAGINYNIETSSNTTTINSLVEALGKSVQDIVSIFGNNYKITYFNGGNGLAYTDDFFWFGYGHCNEVKESDVITSVITYGNFPVIEKINVGLSNNEIADILGQSIDVQYCEAFN